MFFNTRYSNKNIRYSLNNKNIETTNLWHMLSNVDVISRLDSNSIYGLSNKKQKRDRKSMDKIFYQKSKNVQNLIFYLPNSEIYQ